MMERTIELLTPKVEMPVPTAGSGGTLNTDITEMLVLMGNRLTGIENQLNTITKMMEQTSSEGEEQTSSEGEEQTSSEGEEQTPSEGEEMKNDESEEK